MNPFQRKPPTCPTCGAPARVASAAGSIRKLLPDGHAITLAGVPVWRCDTCDIAMDDDIGQIAARMHPLIEAAMVRQRFLAPAPMADRLVVPQEIEVRFGPDQTDATQGAFSRPTAVKLIEDLELPPEVQRGIQQFIAGVRDRERIAEALGSLAHRADQNFLNLWGPPGVGKSTLAAAIAHELGLPLLCLDASQIISKWQGDSEKNLRTAFAEAKREKTLLFVDEADSLVARRSAGDAGGDRGHNQMINQLIRELNTYEGAVLFASNLRDNYDPALARRMTEVHVPAPDAFMRRRIWRRKLAIPAFPEVPDDIWLGHLDARIGLAQLDPERPFTAADIEQVVHMAVKDVAAERTAGQLRIERRHIERAFDQHLRALVQAAGGRQDPATQAPAMMQLVLNDDVDMAERLGVIANEIESVDPVAARDPRKELAKLRKAVREARTLGQRLRYRHSAMRSAGIPEDVSQEAANRFAFAMQANVNGELRRNCG